MYIEGLGVEYIVEMLIVLVDNQWKIMVEGFEVEDVIIVFQVWCLYKEVMMYLFVGLEVLEDIMFLWVDDNWGNVRWLLLLNEMEWLGGVGVYYYFDYVGDMRSYKWINMNQLSKMMEQMYLLVVRGVDRIWIVNVGDMKVLEVLISYYFDLVYDYKRWYKDSMEEWVRLFVMREYGLKYVVYIGDILERYGMLVGRRKFELIELYVYLQINYGEVDVVLYQWVELYKEVQVIYDDLLVEQQLMFFQMIFYLIMVGEIVNKIQIGGVRNMFYLGQKRNVVNKVILEVLFWFLEDVNLMRRWDVLLDGKWKYFMDQMYFGFDGYWQQFMRNIFFVMVYV